MKTRASLKIAVAFTLIVTSVPATASALSAAAAPANQQSVRTAPVGTDRTGANATAQTQQIGVPSATRPDARTTAGSPATLRQTSTKPFSIAGVTWAPGTGTGDVVTQIRTRSKGTWSSWTALEPSGEGSGGRPGTDPLWVNQADGVEVTVKTVSGPAAADVKVALVNPGADQGGSTGAGGRVSGPARVTAGDGSPSYTAMPAMKTRKQWGARAARGCDSPRYGRRTLGVVVHHTVNSNSYSASQAASIVRGIQAYHMDARGWCDIGYNVLIDRFGQVFEGRSGGMLQQVRAAHAGNSTVNTYTTGISLIGDLDKVAPSAAMKTATVKVAGWRLGTNFLPATGTYPIGGKRLARIAGHRDVARSGIRPSTATACPGRHGYSWLTSTGGLRTRVANYISRYSTPIKSKARALGGATTGYISVGEYPTGTGRRAVFQKGDIYSNRGGAGYWVNGSIQTEYLAVKAQNGALGWPTSNVVAVSTGKARQHFQNGAIYRVQLSATSIRGYALYGGVYRKYASLGAYNSRLGVPKSRVNVSGSSDVATFARGRISYNRTTKVASVTYF